MLDRVGAGCRRPRADPTRPRRTPLGHRRRPGVDAHRPDPRDKARAGEVRPDRRRHRPVRVQRGLRVRRARVDAGDGRTRTTRSTSTAAASHSDIPSARPAPGSWPPCSTSSNEPAVATACRPCARAAARRTSRSSRGCEAAQPVARCNDGQAADRRPSPARGQLSQTSFVIDHGAHRELITLHPGGRHLGWRPSGRISVACGRHGATLVGMDIEQFGPDDVRGGAVRRGGQRRACHRLAVGPPADAAPGRGHLPARLGRGAADSVPGNCRRGHGRRGRGPHQRVRQPAPGLALGRGRSSSTGAAGTGRSSSRASRSTRAASAARRSASTAGRARRPAASRPSTGSTRRARRSTGGSILADLDWAMIEKLHAEALDHASSYEIVRRVGRTPDDELDAVAEMSAAINDAPDRRPGHRGRGVPAGADPRATRTPRSRAATSSTASSPGTGRPASSPATRSSPSTRSAPTSATSTTRPW